MRRDYKGRIVIDIDISRWYGRKRPLFLRVLVFVLVFSWLFAGWPQIFEKPKVPSEVAHVKAAAPSGIIVAWPSTRGTIPSGWSAVASLNGMFVEGTIASPSVATQGALNHAHTAPVHQHDLGNHTHAGTTGNAVGSGISGGGTGVAIDGHNHTITTAGNNDLNIATVSNFNAESNNPPYTEVVWIKSDGTQNIPDGAWAFLASTSLPGSWATVSGGRFLKGAVDGGDGGSIGGNSDNHTHTDAGHTHLENSHTHTGTAGGSLTTKKSGAGSGYSSGTHTHTISGGGVVATEGVGYGNVAEGDAMPPWYALNIIQNNTGGYSLPNGAIAMWDQATDSIPAGWELCDGSGICPNLSGKFIMGANATTAINATGGALTHTHSAGANHTHAINSHNHNFTVDGDTTGQVTVDKTGNNVSAYTHMHTLSLSGGGTTSGQTAVANENTENRPYFKEAVFIRNTLAAAVSVAVSGGPVLYGTLNIGMATRTTSTGLDIVLTATNDGGGTETFNIKTQDSLTAGGAWQINSVQATGSLDRFAHEFCIDTAARDCDSDPAWTAMATTSYTTLTTSSVGTGDNILFDLQITAPTTTSSYGIQYVDVTVQAVGT